MSRTTSRNRNRTNIVPSKEPEPQPTELVPRATPLNLVSMVEHVAIAIKAGADDLRAPLQRFLQTGAGTELRLKLAVLVVGVELEARGGDSSPRIEAAKKAIAAWEGTAAA